MKKILCYGDSNTYGYIPETFGRYTKNERWTGILSELLSPEYEILEQGMNNRTGFFKNPENIKLCGGEYISKTIKILIFVSLHLGQTIHNISIIWIKIPQPQDLNT